MTAHAMNPLIDMIAKISSSHAQLMEMMTFDAQTRLFTGRTPAQPKQAANDTRGQEVKEYNIAETFRVTRNEMTHADQIVEKPRLKRFIQPLQEFKTTVFGMVKAGGDFVKDLFNGNAHLGVFEPTPRIYGGNVLPFRSRSEMALT